jgi:hypothetical protein
MVIEPTNAIVVAAVAGLPPDLGDRNTTAGKSTLNLDQMAGTHHDAPVTPSFQSLRTADGVANRIYPKHDDILYDSTEIDRPHPDDDAIPRDPIKTITRKIGIDREKTDSS